jgi:hypothetical protein
VAEGPVGHLRPLSARHRIGEAKVDAQVDASVDDILCRVREPSVRARLLHHLKSVTRHRKGHLVSPEEVREHSYTGDTARAEALLRGLRGSAPSEQRGRALLASFLAARGAKRDSLALVKDVLSRAYQDHHVAYSVGAAYAGLGLTEEAFRWMRQAADSGLLCSAWYLNDPLLAPLRTDPAFAPFIGGVTARANVVGVDYIRELLLR